MTLKYKNNAQTTLSVGINDSVTSIAVVDGSVFPALTGIEYFYMTLEDVSLNREVVKVTARSGNTLTVVRAQDGSVARAFSIGDKAEGRLVAAMLADLSAPSYILAALLTVDGTGSTLDADLLDGQSSAYYLAASSYTAADVLSKLLTVDGTGSGLDADLLDGQSSAYYLAAGSYTAADVLSKLLTVDGTGSGLDADLLDGQSSAYYLAAGSYTAADVLSKLLTVDGTGSGLDADLLDGQSSAYYLAAGSYTAADVLSKLLTVDGAGSGLDADLLDGQSSAYYLAAGSYTAADVLSKLLTVDGAGSGLDADLLDGYNIGTSGGTIPLLNGTNTWSGVQINSSNWAFLHNGNNTNQTLELVADAADGLGRAAIRFITIAGGVGSSSRLDFVTNQYGVLRDIRMRIDSDGKLYRGAGTAEIADTSNTLTLSNKTLSSPTLSGTVAGSPTFSGQLTLTSASEPLIINRTAVAQYSVILKDNGTTRGYLGVTSGYPFIVQNESASTVLSVTSAGVVNANTSFTAAGVAVPTISSTDTLSNKTLSSPTLSGTVAGNASWSGTQTFSTSPVLDNATAIGVLFRKSAANKWTAGMAAGTGTGDNFEFYNYTLGGNALVINSSTSAAAFTGAITSGGVAVPTISSTDTLTNKTLSSPTVSGTIAGGATWTGAQVFSNATTIFGNTYAGAFGAKVYVMSGASTQTTLALHNPGVGFSHIGYDATDSRLRLYNCPADGILANGFGLEIATTGVLSVKTSGGTAVVPTISSTDTLTNKTLSSPTLSGTVAGNATWSGYQTFQATATFGTVFDEAIRLQNDGGYISFYNDAGSTRRGYIYNGGTYLSLVNDITNGDWAISTNGTGTLRLNGVAVPTISSTDTLSNKTLSSPTLSGTVAGTPTWSNVQVFPAGSGIANVGTGLLFNNTANDYLHTIDKDNTGVIFSTNSASRAFRWSINGSNSMALSTAAVLSVGGVVVPTISSTDTLSNKTLSSPALTGAVSSTGGISITGGTYNASNALHMFFASSAANIYALQNGVAWRALQLESARTDINYITNGPVYIGSSSGLAWHSANDGAGSGLNADLLDGYSSASFVLQNGGYTASTITFTGVGGNSGNGNADYHIYQEAGAWTHPYPDLILAYHTGIKIMSTNGYGGTKFYGATPSYIGATDPLFIVGNIDNATSHISHAVTSTTTDGFGLEFLINGTYADGRYAHRLAKYDVGGGVPLYMQKTSGTAGAWTTIARFGSWTSSSAELEVFEGSGNGSYGALRVNNSATNGEASIGYRDASDSDTSSWVVGKSVNGIADAFTWFYNGTRLTLSTAGVLSTGSATYWHSANDGSGSTLDADTVDTVHASQIVYGGSTGKSLGDQSNMNSNTLRSGFYYYDNPSNGPITDWQNWIHVRGDGWGDGNQYGFQISSAFHSNNLYYRRHANGTYYSWFNMWHSGSDGSGSGLDADLLDGYNADINANASTVAVRSSAGDLNVSSIYASNWFRSTGGSGWYNETFGGGIFMQDTTYVKVYGGKAFYVPNSIDATGNITAYYSDERLKTKTRNVENALDQVSSLTPFFYIENETARSLGYNNLEEQVGLSAQEVQRILPQVVHRAPVDIAVDENGNKYSKSGEDYLTVDYARVVPLLVAAIKELRAEVTELKRAA